MNRLRLKAVAAACFACGISGPALAAEDDVRASLLNTLDNLEASVLGTPMEPLALQKITEARDRVLLASPAEINAIPESYRGRLDLIESSSGQLSLLRETAPAPGPATKDKGLVPLQSLGPDYETGPLDDPSYPSFSWSFAFSDPGEPEGDNDSGSGSDTCDALGYNVNDRFVTLNAAIVAEAAKDIAEQACDLTVAGFNVALACIVTDVAAYVAIGINENQELCNDFLTAAEVTATWDGLNVVHGNVQHLHDDVAAVDSAVAAVDSAVANVDADLAQHDADIKSDLGQHDGDIKTALAAHDADIKALLNQVLAKQDAILGELDVVKELLNTPSGRRPEWPTKP
jgi:hypothetical protein